jgi:hypothetical protein
METLKLRKENSELLAKDKTHEINEINKQMEIIQKELDEITQANRDLSEKIKAKKLNN